MSLLDISAGIGEPTPSGKFEIRSSKSETNSNGRTRQIQNEHGTRPTAIGVSNIVSLKLRACFGFRISDFNRHPEANPKKGHGVHTPYQRNLGAVGLRAL